MVQRDEAAFIHAYDRAFDSIDKAHNLPNRTINLLIQWTRQSGNKTPEHRRTEPELAGLRREVIDGVEAIVAESFSAAPPHSGH